MSIEIIFVDGCVNAGKTTFISKLNDAFKLVGSNVNVCVINEPIERECTTDIVDDIGYPALFNFIVSRKVALLKDTISKWIAEKEYPNTLNVIIVERSLDGDRHVRGFYNDVSAGAGYDKILLRPYVNAHHVLIRRMFGLYATEESRRLSDHYSKMDEGHIITNRDDGGYNLFLGAVSLAIDMWNAHAKETH